ETVDEQETVIVAVASGKLTREAFAPDGCRLGCVPSRRPHNSASLPTRPSPYAQASRRNASTVGRADEPAWHVHFGAGARKCFAHAGVPGLSITGALGG